MVTYILLALFFIWMVWIGWRAGKVSSDTKVENFLIANRSALGILVAIGIAMSWIDAVAFGYVGGLGYDVGWGVLAYVFGATGGFLYIARLAPKIRQLGVEGDMYMMSDIIRYKYSQRCGAAAGVAVFFYFALWMLLQFVVGPQVIESIMGIPTIVTSVVMGVVTLGYLLLGGFRSQVYTDAAQFGLFCALALVLAALFVPHVSEWVAPIQTVRSLGLWPWVSLFIVALVGTVAAPDVWQRIYSARSGKDAKSSMYLCAALMFVVYMVFASFGMITKQYGWAASSNDVASAIFLHIVPEWFLPVATVAFFAIIMSTIATTLFGTALTVSNDLLYGLGLVKKDKLLFWQRIIMIIVLVTAVVITTTNLPVMSVVFYALSACVVPFPIVILILYNRKVDERSVFISLLLSLATFLAGLVLGYLNGAGAIWPLAGGIIGLVGTETFLHLIGKRKVLIN